MLAALLGLGTDRCTANNWISRRSTRPNSLAMALRA
jgi:hypothetical protein